MSEAVIMTGEQFTERVWPEFEGIVLRPDAQLAQPILTVPSGLPTPQGTRILVRMFQESEKTASGLYVSQNYASGEQDATIKAQVISLGPDAYQSTAIRAIAQPYCKPGDWVMLASFAGNRFKFSGDESEYRIVQDTAVIAVLPQPEKIERFSRA